MDTYARRLRPPLPCSVDRYRQRGWPSIHRDARTSSSRSQSLSASAVRATERKRRRSVSIGVFVVGVPVTRRRKSCSTGSPRHLVTKAPIAGKQERRILTEWPHSDRKGQCSCKRSLGFALATTLCVAVAIHHIPIQTDRNTATRSHAGCAPPASMWLKPEGQARLQKDVQETERTAS
jgi:hypothetical protein